MNTTTSVNTTTIPTTPSVHKPRAIAGLAIYIVFSIILLILLAFFLFIRNTTLYIGAKYYMLQCYTRCCKCSPFYTEYLTQEARDLQNIVHNANDSDDDIY